MLNAGLCNCQICRKLLAELSSLQSSGSSSKTKSQRIQRLTTICYEAMEVLFAEGLLPNSQRLGATMAATISCYGYIKQQTMLDCITRLPSSNNELADDCHNKNAAVNPFLQHISEQIAPLKKQNSACRDVSDILEAFVDFLKPLTTCAAQLSVDQKALSQEDIIYKSFLIVCDQILTPEITAANNKLKAVINKNSGLFKSHAFPKLNECFIKFIDIWLQAFNANSASITSVGTAVPINISSAHESTSLCASAPGTPTNFMHGLTSARSQDSGLNDPLSSAQNAGDLDRSSGNISERSSLSSTPPPPAINSALINVTDADTLAEVQQLQISESVLLYRKIIQDILQFNQVLMEQACVATYGDVSHIFLQYEKQLQVILNSDYTNASLTSFVYKLSSLSNTDFDYDYYQTTTVRNQFAHCNQKNIPGKNKNTWEQNKEYFGLLLAALELTYEANSCIARLQNAVALRVVSVRQNAHIYVLDQDGKLTIKRNKGSTPSPEQTYCAMVKLKTMIESRLFGYKLKLTEYCDLVKQTQEYEHKLSAYNKDIWLMANNLAILKKQYNAEAEKGFFSKDRGRMTSLEKDIKRVQERQQQNLLEWRLVAETFSSFKSKLVTYFLTDTSYSCSQLQQEIRAVNHEMAIWNKAHDNIEQNLQSMLNANPRLQETNTDAVRNSISSMPIRPEEVRCAEKQVLETEKWRDIDKSLKAGVQKLRKALSKYSDTLSPAERVKLSRSDLGALLSNQSQIPLVENIRQQVQQAQQINMRCAHELEIVMNNPISQEQVSPEMTLKDWIRNGAMDYIYNNNKFVSANNVDELRTWIAEKTPYLNKDAVVNFVHKFAHQNCWMLAPKFLQNSYTNEGIILSNEKTSESQNSQACNDALIMHSLDERSLIVRIIRHYYGYKNCNDCSQDEFSNPMKLEITFTVKQDEHEKIAVPDFHFYISPSPEAFDLSSPVATMWKKLTQDNNLEVFWS